MVLRFLTVLCLALLASACSPSPPQTAPSSTQASEWSREVHWQLNAYRRQKNLPALEYHKGLEQLCLDHSQWMCRKRGHSFRHGSHVSHSGSGARSRIAHIEYGMEAWGENVAYISNTPSDAATQLIVMWKASPPHHKAMLDDWTHAATAIHVADDGAIFATMNFGRLRPIPTRTE